MNDILNDLYYGRISPWERCPTRSAESRETDRKIEDEKRYFIQKMSLDDCQRFQELENLYTQSSDTEQVDAFAHGFKLGAELIIAVLAEVDRQKALRVKLTRSAFVQRTLFASIVYMTYY